MRFEVKQIDTTNNNRAGAEKVENEINGIVEKIEKAGNHVTGEYLLPQGNVIRSVVVLWYEKGTPNDTRYSFYIIDNRDSYEVVGKVLNAGILELEKSGRTAVRVLPMPKMNNAYTQFLVAHVPNGNKVVEKPVEKPRDIIKEESKKEVIEDVEKSSAAITA